MPIYEYQCTSCQEVTEAWQSLADEPLTTCSSCAGPLKKLISMSSFHLKGGGWYADGYSNGSGAATKSCSSSTSCPKSDSSTTTSSTDSKPTCSQGACCGA